MCYTRGAAVIFQRGHPFPSTMFPKTYHDIIQQLQDIARVEPNGRAQMRCQGLQRSSRGASGDVCE